MSTKKALYIATFVSTIGDGMFYIATAWYVYQKMHTSLAVGILLAFNLIPIMLVFPFTGYVADKYNRKTIAILMDIARFILISICGLLFLYTRGNISVFHIYFLTGLVKIGDCFFAPSITSLIKINFDSSEYIKIFSTNNTLQQIGTILGSVLTGLLLLRIDITYILFFDALSFVLSCVMISMMRKDAIVTINNEASKDVVSNFMEGVKYTLGKKTVLFLIILCGAPSFIVNMLNTLLCEHTEVALGLTVREYSILDASFGIGCAFMGAVITIISQKIEEKKFGIMGYLFLPMILYCLSLTHNYYITLVEIIIIGAIIMVISINAKTLFAKIIDKEYIGRVDSYSYTLNSLIVSFSGILIGYLSSITSTSMAFRLYSVVSIIFLVCECKIIKNADCKMKLDN